MINRIKYIFNFLFGTKECIYGLATIDTNKYWCWLSNREAAERTAKHTRSRVIRVYRRNKHDFIN